MFQGSVPLKTASEAKAAGVEILIQNDDLKNTLVPEAIVGRRVVFYLFGYAAVAAGVFLLVGALINIPHITW